MLYLAIKAALSGFIIAIVSEVAKRYPGFGALIASRNPVTIGMVVAVSLNAPGARSQSRTDPLTNRRSARAASSGDKADAS